VLSFSSLVALAAATTAALFSPLRRWAERIVDRRFDRSRDDADRITAALRAA
jgi:hypothetical protein